MISSGIKRGVAATAISALAVAGIPSLAGTANAAPGDNFTVTYTGPALNGGDEGALVILRAEDNEIDESLLALTGTSSNEIGDQNSTEQTAEILSATVVQDTAPGQSAFEFIYVRIQTETFPVGGTATFRIFENDSPADTDLDNTEARQPVSISTAGPLASIDVSPASQSAPENIESGAYTVTLRDSAGRTTQLLEADQLNITDNGALPATVVVTETGPDTAAANDNTITSDEIVRGTDTFTARGNAVGSYQITVTDALTPAINDTATLNVTEAATITANELNIVTAADTWNGFGNTPDSDGNAARTIVRVDQNTIRFDFDAPNSEAGSNVRLAVDGTDTGPGDGVTFGGQSKATYTTTLDANGNGSITVVADAASVQDGDKFETDINGFAQRIEFARATQDNLQSESDTYFCQDDAACTVTAVVTDQFGNPVTTGQVEAERTGPQNDDASPQRKPVGADGTVDFTFTDTNPVDGGIDGVLFEYFNDQFDNTVRDSDTATIEYSATGQGSDFVVSVDGDSTESPAYDAGDQPIIPLYDTVAEDTTDPRDEDATIGVVNGEPNQAVTLSVDNGALILAPTETKLSQGSASQNATLTVGGVLPAGYRVIGTTSGPVTLTVTSANRTETAPLTVSAQNEKASARNVTLSGPATVPSGTDQITFTAVVTDAFGNPVPGVENGVFNKVVTGPGQYQDGDAVSDANGEIRFNVDVDDNAEGDVTLTIDAADIYQFGANEDRLVAVSTTDDGEGLSASSDVASATTTVQGPVVEPPTGRTPIDAVLEGRNTGKKTDKLKVITTPRGVADGARVNLFRVNKNGVRELVESSELNDNGIKRFQIPDNNGKRKTKYVARVKRTDDSKAVKRTNFKRVR